MDKGCSRERSYAKLPRWLVTMVISSASVVCRWVRSWELSIIAALFMRTFNFRFLRMNSFTKSLTDDRDAKSSYNYVQIKSINCHYIFSNNVKKKVNSCSPCFVCQPLKHKCLRRSPEVTNEEFSRQWSTSDDKNYYNNKAVIHDARQIWHNNRKYMQYWNCTFW